MPPNPTWIRRIKQNLCGFCGDAPPKPGFKTCEVCQIDSATRSRERRKYNTQFRMANDMGKVLFAFDKLKDPTTDRKEIASKLLSDLNIPGF